MPLLGAITNPAPCVSLIGEKHAWDLDTGVGTGDDAAANAATVGRSSPPLWVLSAPGVGAGAWIGPGAMGTM